MGKGFEYNKITLSCIFYTNLNILDFKKIPNFEQNTTEFPFSLP